MVLVGCGAGAPVRHPELHATGDRRMHLACPRRAPNKLGSEEGMAANRTVWIRMIEDRRPLTRIRASLPSVPKRSILGRTSCAEGTDTCWLVLGEGSLIGRVDADLTQLLDESGYALLPEQGRAVPPVWLEVLIEELWVDGEAVSNHEVARVVLILTLIDPRTETARWSRTFDADEIQKPSEETARGEGPLRRAYCRVLEQIAEALQAPDFAAAVAEAEP